MRTCVLLIENGHAGRSVLARLFGWSGLTVYAFSSVDEASEHLEAGTFDVALLDGDLPGGKGIVAAEELSSGWPSMRVVVMVKEEVTLVGVRKRCPEVEVVLKSMVMGGVVTKVGVGVGAICNN